MNRRRVVVTGVGALTPLGGTAEETWQGLLAGRSGVDRVTRFDPAAFASKISAQLKEFAPETIFGKKEARRIDPSIQYAIVAAREAVAQAHLVIDDDNRDRVGVVFGSGMGGVNSWHQNHDIMRDRGPERVSPFLIPMLLGNMAAGMVAIELGACGPNKSVQTACATSAHCIGDGLRLVQNGEADVVIAGGTEAAITELAFAGFCNMRALSSHNESPETASRPFDRTRDGFVMGEGAGALVLEAEDHAKARGATILGVLAGFGQTCDAYHMAAPHPAGNGAARAMRLAIQDAGLGTSDVGYINAHATSTPAGDSAEVAAIRQLFNGHSVETPVSATKSMTGHLLGASGAVELIACLHTIRDGMLPPTINYEQGDEGFDLDCVPNQARERKVEVALSNAFGFGGHNASLLVTAS